MAGVTRVIPSFIRPASRYMARHVPSRYMSESSARASDFAKRALEKNGHKKPDFEEFKGKVGCPKDTKVLSFEEYVDTRPHLSNVPEALQKNKAIFPEMSEAEHELTYATDAVADYKSYVRRETTANDPGTILSESFFEEV